MALPGTDLEARDLAPRLVARRAFRTQGHGSARSWATTTQSGRGDEGLPPGMALLTSPAEETGGVALTKQHAGQRQGLARGVLGEEDATE